MQTLRMVCYQNQFFGQLGGEDKAGVGPQVMAGAVGAARAVQQVLGGLVRWWPRCFAAMTMSRSIPTRQWRRYYSWSRRSILTSWSRAQHSWPGASAN